jgi:hypothetical protein
MNELEIKKAVYDLAFGVYAHGDNLFSAKMMKMRDGKVTEWKHGNGTTLGHAAAIAEGLLSGYAVCAHEVTAADYYDNATVI